LWIMVRGKYVTKFGTLVHVPIAQRDFDPPPRGVVLTVDALGVDPQEYLHTVPGPFRDLGRRDACVQLRRYRRWWR